MINFENVTAKYPGGTGIFNITFSVEKGEMKFLMGPTGAGKSTVLRALYRDLLSIEGRIFVDGVDVVSLKKHKIPYLRRKIGMIFQDYKLINDRTVFENIALPLHISGTPKKIVNLKVREVAEKVGLENKIKIFPKYLSGGEQQRVSIARALVKEPVIVLADEPTGNLDLNISDEILDILEIATDSGAAVLMSTHNFPLVRPRQKQYIELSEGRMIL
jgi:cell division transport system ATP-binding protein